MEGNLSVLSGGGFAKALSSVKGLFVKNSVLVNIRDVQSGDIEFTFRLRRSHKMQRVYDAFRGRRGGEDSFILKLDGRRVARGHTPDCLGMSDHVELSCVPAVKVDIRNFWTQKIDCSFVIESNDTFRLIHQACVKKRGNGGFDLSFHGRKVKLSETPSSLGMKNHVEFTCVPVPLVTIVIKDTERPGKVHKFLVRRDQKLSKIYLKYRKMKGDGSFFFMHNGYKISLDETPDSLGMKDRAVIICVPSSHVIIDIFNVETQEVQWVNTINSSSQFQLLYKYCEDKRSQHKGKSRSSFYLEFNGSRINHDDTPHSLGMGDGDRVVVSYTPNPVVEIDLLDSYGESVRTFRLKPHQPLRKIYNAHSEISLYLMFNGSKVPPEATPDSLGMKGHATLSWEQTVFNGIHNIKYGKEVTTLDMEGGVDNDMSSTIDIVFVDTSSSDEVLLRYVSYWKMKTLLSRYAAMREVPLKSLRFKFEDRMLFVSSIGNKSPYDLGMQNHDVVYVSRLGNVDVKQDEAGTTKKSGPSQASTSAAKGKTKSKKKAPTQPTYSTIDEEERLRRAHSKMLSRVFDEANPQFKKIRQHLNSLALEHTPPKSKSVSPRARVKESKTDMSNISSFSLGNKAIKNRFNIVAGEVINLYKSTKPSKKMKAQVESISIDLHGYTKEAAVEKLNASLPSWIDAAMRGDYPFVVPVTIICGAGGQVLSEVVERWIRDNERVANARKNMFI